MASYVVRPAAKRDLFGIWDYTYNNWGERQADAYLGGLFHMFQTLAETPTIGLPSDDIHEGLRVSLCGKHLVFYFETNSNIDIVRVLHERMDISSHL